MIIIVGCNKGGAGKTTTASNLAVALAANTDGEVCLVDADNQRSLSRWHADRLEAEANPALTLVEKRDNISQALIALGERFAHVVVDVAGRNSREMITGATVADLLLAPHQASQLDLDTLAELQAQTLRVRDFNPGLRVLVYHAMASTNPTVKDIERASFLEYVAEFPEFEPLRSVGYYRKAYKDAIPLGLGVTECNNLMAAQEIMDLTLEVMGYGC